MSNPRVPSTAIPEASISINDSVAQDVRLYINGDEWGPGEYVVKVLPGEGSKPLEMTHERVIRCRDCAHFHGWDEPEGHYETCILGRSNSWVDENGFCAWAEPKEES